MDNITLIIVGVAFLLISPELVAIVKMATKESECDHEWDLFGSNPASFYVKCVKCRKLETGEK